MNYAKPEEITGVSAAIAEYAALMMGDSGQVEKVHPNIPSWSNPPCQISLVTDNGALYFLIYKHHNRLGKIKVLQEFL